MELRDKTSVEWIGDGCDEFTPKAIAKFNNKVATLVSELYADPKNYKRNNHFSGFFDFFTYKINCPTYIVKVLYKDPVTVVFWSDDTKTVAKCSEEDVFSPETGLSICIMKKMLGATAVRNIFYDWTIPNDGVVEVRDVRRKHKEDEL